MKAKNDKKVFIYTIPEKKVLVSCCKDCPAFGYSPLMGFVCYEIERFIDNPSIIQAWCPLVDKEKG